MKLEGSLHKRGRSTRWRYQYTDAAGVLRTRTLTEGHDESIKLARLIDIENDPRNLGSTVPPELSGIPAIRKHEMSGRCVYFLCRSGKVVYVGQTIDLGKRACEHLTRGVVFDSVYWVPVGLDQNLLAIERYFIGKLKPELNATWRRRNVRSNVSDFVRVGATLRDTTCH